MRETQGDRSEKLDEVVNWYNANVRATLAVLILDAISRCIFKNIVYVASGARMFRE